MSQIKATNGSIMDTVVQTVGAQSKQHPYFLFEPWDIEERSPEILLKAKEDGFDLQSPENFDLYGASPRDFQTGYLFCDSFVGAIFASNQSGKSYVALMEQLICLTGEIPISLRHPKGYDTGVKREISRNNIIRFGRHDATTGEFLDHDVKAVPSGAWNCGTVKGSGIFPKDKIAKKGSKSWVVTFKEARDQSWWPLVRGMIPESMVDTTRRGRGFDQNESVVYLADGAEIHFITYEQGATRLEAAGELQEFKSLHSILFDEEPPDSSYWAAATQRVKKIRLVTTPYKGLSWTFEDIVSKAKSSPDIELFHCIKYDCPYWTEADIDKSKATIKRWQIGARIYGIHTEAQGRPYYEEIYDEIQNALGMREQFTPCTIFPTFTWDDIPRVLAMRRDEIEIEEAVDPDGRDVWKIYEFQDDNDTYFMSVDTAEGTEDPTQEQDKHSAQIFRFPHKDEVQGWPVKVASIDCSLPAAEFARICMYGAAAYNNAIMAPECVGKSAGTFLNESDGWPFWFTMIVTNDRTKKQTDKIGFHTSSKNRTTVFNLVGSFMKDHLEHPSLGFRHKLVLMQVAGCIVGKQGRPDHAKRKCNDALFAHGIACYVFRNAEGQIRNNINAFVEKKADALTFEEQSRLATKNESRPLLGSKRGGMDQRKLQMKAKRAGGRHGRT